MKLFKKMIQQINMVDLIRKVRRLRLMLYFGTLILLNKVTAQQKINSPVNHQFSDSSFCVFDFDMDYQLIKIKVEPNILRNVYQDIPYSSGQKLIIKLYAYKGQFFVDSIIFKGFDESSILKMKAVIYNSNFSFYKEVDKMKYSNMIFSNLIPIQRKESD
jgi:hypothetical protein